MADHALRLRVACIAKFAREEPFGDDMWIGICLDENPNEFSFICHLTGIKMEIPYLVIKKFVFDKNQITIRFNKFYTSNSFGVDGADIKSLPFTLSSSEHVRDIYDYLVDTLGFYVGKTKNLFSTTKTNVYPNA